MTWDYYSGKVIFVTGGSGFVGTTLIYRLVTQAPVSHVYILCRGGLPKIVEKWRRWLPPEVVEEMTNPALVTILEGDMLLPDMGLTPRWLETIKFGVDIIIHSASSIALLKPLEKLVSPIIDATERLARLALGCQKVQCFVFVSTAYCNAYLFPETDGTLDLKVAESMHPVHDASANTEATLEQELQEVYTQGTSSVYRARDFGWGYAYAKHITERRLHQLFEPSSTRLLIIRPSIIEPAQTFPYRGFCIPTSTPRVIFTAGLALTMSHTVYFSSRFAVPVQESTIDYVPVDVVVDRLLAHVSYGTSGPVHAVSGGVPFGYSWGSCMKFRRIPLKVRPGFTRQSWHSKNIHPLARVYKIAGCSFDFVESKTRDLWASLPREERGQLHLFADHEKLLHDHRHIPEDQLWECIMHLTARSRVSRFLAKLFYRRHHDDSHRDINEHSRGREGMAAPPRTISFSLKKSLQSIGIRGYSTR